MVKNNVVPIVGDTPDIYQKMLSQFDAAELDQILDQIALLSSGFPQGNRNEEEVRETIKAYATVVEGLPIEPIELAVRNFLHGVVPDQNAKFMPTAPEFSKEVRRVFFQWEFRRRSQ